MEVAARGRGLRLIERLAGLTPSGRAGVARRVGAVRLREHDLQLRDRLVRDGPVGRSTRAWASATASSGSASRIAASVGLNALVSPVLGAMSDRGGRRLPYLLFFTAQCVHRHGPHRHPARRRLRPHDPRAGAVHARELLVPGGADLLRRDAAGGVEARRRAAGCPGSAWRSATSARSSSRLLILVTGSGVDATDVLHGGRAVRASSRSRSSCSCASRPAAGTGSGWATPSRRGASSARRSPTPGRCRACFDSSSRGSSTPTRSTRSS